MTRRAIISIVLSAVCLTSSARAATPDEVDAAIASGVKWLTSTKGFVDKGHWETSDSRGEGKDGSSITGPQWGGRTALCTYAILASGASPSDERLKKPIDFLRKADIIGYYALGLRPQVWLYLPQTPENRAAILRDFKLLWAGVEKDPSKKDVGLYDYTLSDRLRIDLSVSQYGVLGMWACAQLEMEIPAGDAKKNQPNFWGLVENKWKGLQDRTTGGWSYDGTAGGSTPSMTAAGVATLFITQEYLHSRDGITCSGNIKYPELEKGIAFLAKTLPPMLATDGGADLYTLYGIERIGVASGLKFLGSVDWYRQGADYLVRNQNKNGSWSDENGEEVSTAFALLFLSRGREAVMMNKMRYDLAPAATVKLEGFWNERARDVANVTRFVGKQVERNLNWQIIDLSVCTVDDLHDAPIAYFSGAQALKFTPDQTAKIKQYVQEGGTLVFNTDCGRKQFGTSVTKLLKDLFGGEPRALETDSVILKNEQFKASTWKQKPDVKALSNGVREIAILLDDDAAKSWQTNEYTIRNDHFALMANIYQYTIDKSHARMKGRTHVVRSDPAITPDKPAIKVARLMVGTTADPEPGGWRRLAAIFNNTLKTPLVVTSVNPEVDDLAGYHVAHLTGVGPVQLKPEVITRLKKFVTDGGLLVIDAAGGDQKFAASVGGQLHNIVDAATAEGGDLLPSSDPLYAIAAGAPLKVEYRDFRRAVGDVATQPALHATKVGGRYGIIFSSDDLTTGLVGNEIDGIRGYAPETATALMSRILLYAKEAKAGPATQAAAATAPTTKSTTQPAK